MVWGGAAKSGGGSCLDLVRGKEMERWRGVLGGFQRLG